MRNLELLLLGAAPNRSPECLQVLQVLSAAFPNGTRADCCAALVGLGNRHRLARHLSRTGFPCYAELVDWVRLLGPLLAWENEHRSLVGIALEGGVESSVCYHTVRRLCATSWTSARRLGIAHWLPVFEGRFQPMRSVDVRAKYIA